MRKATVLQVVEETGLTEYTIRQWIKQKKIPHMRTGGSEKGRIILDMDLVEDYIKKEMLSSIGTE